ncbi:MAG: nitronate monooxygenase [Bacteroidia bacterium]|jgi:nitronate monooxygenase|nr:nitronate monooxygenase [Bacteroidia bacterium]
MKLKNQINNVLNLSIPVIMAPMFLVSNVSMIKAAMHNGIAGVFPSLNFRKQGELERILQELNDTLLSIDKGNYGVNLIVQKSNALYKKHLEICIKYQVPFFVTSLGDPTETINQAHAYGGKVFCDVTTLKHAEICAKAGCDGFIAVGHGAGGHAGEHPLHVLIPALKKAFPQIPVIAAGGIATGSGILATQVMGADGVSIGTRFIASTECSVNEQYKQAITNAGMDDIVLTEKLSGTPCNVINTEDVKRLGYKQHWLQRWLSKYKRTKKWYKLFVQINGMKKLEKSVLPNYYNQMWSAGKSVHLIDEVASCDDIVEQLIKEYKTAYSTLDSWLE